MTTIADILQGRSVYGRAGGNIANILANSRANGLKQLDPRLGNAGFMHRNNSMDENPTVAFEQYANQDKWDGAGDRTIGGKRMLQIGDHFLDGRNVNADDLLKIVKDPSKVIWDEEAGLVTDEENLLYKGAELDLVDKLIIGGIMAGSGAVMGNAFGLIGSGVGEGAAATGAFDTAGWAGTGINGATGVAEGALGASGAAAGVGEGMVDMAGLDFGMPMDLIQMNVPPELLPNMGLNLTGPAADLMASGGWWDTVRNLGGSLLNNLPSAARGFLGAQGNQQQRTAGLSAPSVGGGGGGGALRGSEANMVRNPYIAPGAGVASLGDYLRGVR